MKVRKSVKLNNILRYSYLPEAEVDSNEPASRNMRNQHPSIKRQENIKNRYSKNHEEQKRLEIQGRLQNRLQKVKQERFIKNTKDKTVTTSNSTSEEDLTMLHEENIHHSTATTSSTNMDNSNSIQQNNGIKENVMPDNSNNTKPNDELKYKPSDIGPFIVFIQKTNINVINVGKMLRKLNIMDIIDIDKVNNIRVRVVTRDYKTANKIMENPTINMLNQYKTFIPNMFVQSVFVVHEVPVEITIQEIEEELIASAPIMKIERMKRWNQEKSEPQDCDKIKVTIRTTTLPKKITMYGANMRFDYFVPSPIICRKCLRYGHVAAVCKGKPTCHNCAEVHELIGPCENKTQCKYCKEEHKTMDPRCKEKSKQRNIKKNNGSEKITISYGGERIFRE